MKSQARLTQTSFPSSRLGSRDREEVKKKFSTGNQVRRQIELSRRPESRLDVFVMT